MTVPSSEGTTTFSSSSTCWNTPLGITGTTVGFVATVVVDGAMPVPVTVTVSDGEVGTIEDDDVSTENEPSAAVCVVRPPIVPVRPPPPIGEHAETILGSIRMQTRPEMKDADDPPPTCRPPPPPPPTAPPCTGGSSADDAARAVRTTQAAASAKAGFIDEAWIASGSDDSVR